MARKKRIGGDLPLLPMGSPTQLHCRTNGLPPAKTGRALQSEDPMQLPTERHSPKAGATCRRCLI